MRAYPFIILLLFASLCWSKNTKKLSKKDEKAIAAQKAEHEQWLALYKPVQKAPPQQQEVKKPQAANAAGSHKVKENYQKPQKNANANANPKPAANTNANANANANTNTNANSNKKNPKYVWQVEGKPNTKNLKIPLTYSKNKAKHHKALPSSKVESAAPQNPQQAVKPQAQTPNHPKQATYQQPSAPAQPQASVQQGAAQQPQPQQQAQAAPPKAKPVKGKGKIKQAAKVYFISFWYSLSLLKSYE